MRKTWLRSPLSWSNTCRGSMSWKTCIANWSMLWKTRGVPDRMRKSSVSCRHGESKGVRREKCLGLYKKYSPQSLTQILWWGNLGHSDLCILLLSGKHNTGINIFIEILFCYLNNPAVVLPNFSEAWNLIFLMKCITWTSVQRAESESLLSLYRRLYTARLSTSPWYTWHFLPHPSFLSADEYIPGHVWEVTHQRVFPLNVVVVLKMAISSLEEDNFQWLFFLYNHS